MKLSTIERPRRRRYARIFAAAFAAILVTAGLTSAVLVTDTEPAAAATVSFSQCNAHAADPSGAALSVTCDITIVNTVDATGGTSAVVYTRVCTLGGCTGDISSSSDVINAVHQCNGSNNEGDSTTICSVDITNNIYTSGGGTATALTLNQCVGSGGGGGTLTTGCIESTTTGATVTQCNGSVDGGGGSITCSASGTSSAAFPVTVDQCNGSERGGGSFMTCTASITNNVFDTDTGAVPPAGSTPGTSAPTGGTPGTGTPEGPGTPPNAVTPPPFVVIPPGFTG